VRRGEKKTFFLAPRMTSSAQVGVVSWSRMCLGRGLPTPTCAVHTEHMFRLMLHKQFFLLSRIFSGSLFALTRSPIAPFVVDFYAHMTHRIELSRTLNGGKKMGRLPSPIHSRVSLFCWLLSRSLLYVLVIGDLLDNSQLLRSRLLCARSSVFGGKSSALSAG
jgi:hypothetical protein